MIMDQRVLVEHYDLESYNSIMRALRTLQMQGFFELAISLEKMTVLDSFDLNAESLAKKIIDMQNTNRVLMTINELAGTLKERTPSE